MDLDNADQAYLSSLIPEDAIPTVLVSAVSFVTADGTKGWKCHVVSDEPVTTSLGLLELAKLDLIARTECGLPITYGDD